MKLSLCLALATRTAAVRTSPSAVTEVHHATADALTDSACHASVRNSVVRSCANRRIGWCTTETCKCPTSAKVVGDDPACEAAPRKFDASALSEKGCRCEFPKEDEFEYTPVDQLYPHFNCPTKFASLDDLMERAHEWCNSDLIPPTRRVPPKLRGLYYFKGLKSQNFAFCPSISEWTDNPEDEDHHLTLRSSPWTHFLYHKDPLVDYQDIKIPKMALSDSHFENSNMPFASGQLIYTFKFKDRSLSYADIIPNQAFMAMVSKFTFVELDKTPDNLSYASEPGDVYARPVHVLVKAKATDIFQYHPIRIMYDNGTIHKKNFELMKSLEPSGEIMRYSQTC